MQQKSHLALETGQNRLYSPWHRAGRLCQSMDGVIQKHPNKTFIAGLAVMATAWPFYPALASIAGGCAIGYASCRNTDADKAAVLIDRWSISGLVIGGIAGLGLYAFIKDHPPASEPPVIIHKLSALPPKSLTL